MSLFLCLSGISMGPYCRKSHRRGGGRGGGLQTFSTLCSIIDNIEQFADKGPIVSVSIYNVCNRILKPWFHGGKSELSTFFNY